MSKIDLHGVVDILPPEKEKVLHIFFIILIFKKLLQYSKAFLIGKEAFIDAYNIFMDPDFQSKKDWRVEIDNENVKIHSKHYPFGNVFALKV